MTAGADAFGTEVAGEAGILAAVLEEHPAAIYRAAIVADAGLAIGYAAHYPTLLAPRGAAYGSYLGCYGIGTYGVAAQFGDVGLDMSILIGASALGAALAIDTGYIKFGWIDIAIFEERYGNLCCMPQGLWGLREAIV